MNGKAVVKILKKAGWPPIVVPVHGSKDLKPGTLRNIEKITGIKFK